MGTTTINCTLLGCESECPCSTFASDSDVSKRCAPRDGSTIIPRLLAEKNAKLERLQRQLDNSVKIATVWRKSYETAEAERVALDAAFRALALRNAELERRLFVQQIDADVIRRLARDEAQSEAETRQ